MKDELDKQLVEKYPKIFANRNGSMYETCMCWGFECDDGWYHLIDSLCTCIQFYLDQKPKVAQVVAAQVKEKFGSLRFYFSGGDEYIHGLVDMVSYLSNSTCEICGNPGKYRDKNRSGIICDKCFESEDA